MGVGGVQNTGSNFQTPPSSNVKSEADFQNMPTDQLIKKLQDGTEQEKQMASAELQKRFPDLFSPEKGDKDKNGGGGGKEGGGKDKGVSGGEKSPAGPVSLEEMLAKLLEKKASGQPLTPEEEKLLEALQKGGGGKEPTAPNEPSDPNTIPSAIVAPGNI